MLREEQTNGQPETLDDPVDEFCYQLALVLRRILNWGEDGIQDEDPDDWRDNSH